MTNKKTILILLFLILTFSSANAEPEQYLTPGSTNQNTYTQTGTGEWLGNTGVTYTRTPASGIRSLYPLIGDVDDDGSNEIINIEGNYLQILNYTTGVGIILEQAVYHGYPTISTRSYNPTPALFDSDNDQILEIYSWNATHMLGFSWNGTQITLNRSAQTGLNTATVAVPYFNINPVVKCAQGNQMSSGNDTCMIVVENRSGAVGFPVLIAYDIEANTLTECTTNVGGGSGFPNPDPMRHNLHLFDGDLDGYLEAYHAYNDDSNGDFETYSIEVGSTACAWTMLDDDALAATASFSDISVSRLDGFTPMITHAYASTTTWDARTIRADNGNQVTGGYCLATCPEGDYASANMFIPGSTSVFGLTEHDVCYYIRNYDQSNIWPGQERNDDAVFCVGEYAGSGSDSFLIRNLVNFSSNHNPIIHYASVSGSAGLLTPRFITSGLTQSLIPSYTTNGACVPVDYEISGSLDIICMNGTSIFYLDDNYLNSNYAFESVAGTPNPVCQGYTYTYTTGISDTEGDAGVCYAQEAYANGTVLANFSNQSVSESQMAGGSAEVRFYYYADEVDNRVLTFFCRDQYHDVYVSTLRPVVVSNDSIRCNDPTVVPVVVTIVPDEEESDSNMLITQFNEFTETFGIHSRLAKSIIALILILLLCGGTAVTLITKSMNGTVVTFIIALEAVVSMIIFYWFGWLSAVPLVIIGLLCAVVIVGYFFGKVNVST